LPAVSDARHPGAARARALLGRHGHWLAALAVFAAVAVVITWPLARDPGATVFGTPGDATGQIALIEYRADLGVGPLSSRTTPDESAPFGLPLPGATALPQVAVEEPLQIARSILGDAVAAYGVVLLLGLILTPLAAYLLCRHVSGSWWGGMVGGLAYGFNPWVIEQAHGHVHFVHLWPLPLLVLGLVGAREGRRWGWPLYGAATLVALYVHTYFTLFVGALIAAFLIVDLVGPLVARRWGLALAALRRAGIAVGVAAVALIPQAVWLQTHRDRIDAALAGTRSPTDTTTYGSRWFEWVVPSYRNPYFDEWTAPYRAARLHGSNFAETSLYVGLVVLALAILGAVVAVLARRAERPRARAAALAGAIVVVGLITSLPRMIHPLGVGLPMPSYLISKVVDEWRVYARLFAVVEIGLAALAAIGVAWIVARLGRRAGPVAALALAALTLVDLSIDSVHFPSGAPPVYALLAEQPPGARVEYPLVPPVEGRHLGYIFSTEAAGRPLLNGGKPGTLGGAVDGRLADPSRPWVAPALAALGVRYAVLHDPGTLPAPGFRPIGARPGGTLYRVAAAPAPLMAVPADGFGAPELRPDGGHDQWLERRTGTIAVLNQTARRTRVRLSTTVAPFIAARDLVVRDGDRVLLRRRIARPTRVAFDVTVPPGTTRLAVETDRPPTRIGTVLGNADPRRVALRFAGIAADGPRTPPFVRG
jgi:hypothetical protein